MPSIKIKNLQPVKLQEFANSSNSINDLAKYEVSLVKGGEVNIDSVLFVADNSEIIGTDVNLKSSWVSARNATIIAYG